VRELVEEGLQVAGVDWSRTRGPLHLDRQVLARALPDEIDLDSVRRPPEADTVAAARVVGPSDELLGDPLLEERAAGSSDPAPEPTRAALRTPTSKK
jgi:hypothetical protein